MYVCVHVGVFVKLRSSDMGLQNIHAYIRTNILVIYPLDTRLALNIAYTHKHTLKHSYSERSLIRIWLACLEFAVRAFIYVAANEARRNEHAGSYVCMYMCVRVLFCNRFSNESQWLLRTCLACMHR